VSESDNGAGEPLATSARLELDAGAEDIREAHRYLPDGSALDVRAFAARQRAARRRFTLLRTYYERRPCRMARIHLLTASAVTLGRFAGYSATFNAIGEELQPIDRHGSPRGELWARYDDACIARLPWEVRDERWIEAHMADTARARDQGLIAAFATEAGAHVGDPTWHLLERHMDMTLGARLIDREAIVGHVPVETAIAHGIATTLGRMVRAGFGLLGRYAAETARALLFVSARSSPLVASYRSTAVTLLVTSVTSWSAWRIYRRGTRSLLRGRLAKGDTWPLLSSVLGPRVLEVHPLIVRFYSNPSAFAVTARLELKTWPARALSFLATLLIGQGLYEAGAGSFPARFRVFARNDGSMHFVRELYPHGRLRVFDSDFVVRTTSGEPTFFEVFVEDRIEVEMQVAPLPGGGLSIKGVRIFYRGIRVPSVGLEVEFQSRARSSEDGVPTLDIEGHLRMRPQSRFGRLVLFGLLRRPEELGCIRYTARIEA
jgi:hypothetical protein